MSNNKNLVTFKMLMPATRITGHNSTPFELTLHNYALGLYLSAFSGSMLSVTTGCTVFEMSTQKVALINRDLTMKIGAGGGFTNPYSLTYTAPLDVYMVYIPINYYSASAITNLATRTIKDMVIKVYP